MSGSMIGIIAEEEVYAGPNSLLSTKCVRESRP
jgi:hypothetical protein